MSDGDSVTTVHEGKHISLVRRGRWEYVTRKGVCGIVGIVAVTHEGKMLLVEQYRPPVNATVIEIPAGLAGDLPGQSNEDLAVAAKRELEEETAYTAGAMTQVGEGTASAGITDEVITMFIANGLKKTNRKVGDGSENITVHEIPLDKVRPWLDDQRKLGKLVDLKVYAALFFAGAKA